MMCCTKLWYERYVIYCYYDIQEAVSLRGWGAGWYSQEAVAWDLAFR